MTIDEFESQPIKWQLAAIYELIVCRLDPMLEQILEHIDGEDE